MEDSEASHPGPAIILTRTSPGFEPCLGQALHRQTGIYICYILDQWITYVTIYSYIQVTYSYISVC
jgi:hypothetical protein